jgi:hypothetical protein
MDAMSDSEISAARYSRRWLAAAAAVFLVWPLQHPVHAAEKAFQQALNYVLTGQTEPAAPPEITDAQTCIVVTREPTFHRYVRYYFERFKMGDSLIQKTYSGRGTNYSLDVEGDCVILEYLDADKSTVVSGFKSAQVALAGDIEHTKKALALIFSSYCKAGKSSALFWAPVRPGRCGLRLCVTRRARS